MGLTLFLHSATRSEVGPRMPLSCAHRVCQQERLFGSRFDVVKRVRFGSPLSIFGMCRFGVSVQAVNLVYLVPSTSILCFFALVRPFHCLAALVLQVHAPVELCLVGILNATTVFCPFELFLSSVVRYCLDSPALVVKLVLRSLCPRTAPMFVFV